MIEPIQCPKCKVTMREREQGDVIIDICPQCRGVWLDSGEMEKLSVRESRYYDDDDDDDDDDRRRRSNGRRRGDDDDDDDDDRNRRYDDRDRDRRDDDRDGDRRDDDRGRYGERDRYGRPKKKKGFLSTMMESFGGEGGGED